MIRNFIQSCLLSVVCVAGATRTTVAWESFPPPLTLSERVFEFDTVAFGEYLGPVDAAANDDPRDGRYRILHVAKSDAATEAGRIVVVAGGGERNPGEHAILTFGAQDVWSASPAIGRQCFDYAVAAPDPSQSDSRRVPYFLNHLDSSDRQISEDAFVELQRASMESIVANSKLIPRECVAARLRDETTQKSHIDLYGRLLGLGGNDSDRELLRELIANFSRDENSFPNGIFGITAGYIMLAGEEGLDWVDEIWLKKRTAEDSVMKTYSVLEAARFLSTYGAGRIPRPRLRESMRLVLNNPEMADLAIWQLARWEDWGQHDRLLGMSHDRAYDEVRIKREITRYMSVSTLVPPEIQAHDPARFQKARQHIRELNASRPEWFKNVAFLLVQRHALSSDGPNPPDDPASKQRREVTIKRLKAIGATVFIGDGRIDKAQAGHVVEINANRKKITDDDLQGVGKFLKMTDLSLEETAITDKGLAHLTQLDGLVWLNLYRTKITDAGLCSVSKLKRLEFLPIGETKITDKGLGHLKKMTQLTYLGLRGNSITDKGLAQLDGLTKLTSLYLGETKVTDAGLQPLTKMPKLKNLWLNGTAISDKAIPLLAELKSLRELHVEDSKISRNGMADLQKRLPACEILNGRK